MDIGYLEIFATQSYRYITLSFYEDGEMLNGWYIRLIFPKKSQVDCQEVRLIAGIFRNYILKAAITAFRVVNNTYTWCT